MDNFDQPIRAPETIEDQPPYDRQPEQSDLDLYLVQKVVGWIYSGAGPRNVAVRNWSKSLAYYRGAHFISNQGDPREFEVGDIRPEDEVWSENLYRRTIRQKTSQLLQFNPKPRLLPLTRSPEALAKIAKTEKALDLIYRKIRVDRFILDVFTLLPLVGNAFAHIYIAEDEGPLVVRQPTQKVERVLPPLYECPVCGLLDHEDRDALESEPERERVCPHCGSLLTYHEEQRFMVDEPSGPPTEEPEGELAVEVVSPLQIWVDWGAKEWSKEEITWLVRMRLMQRDVAEERFGRDLEPFQFEATDQSSDALRNLRVMMPDLTQDAADWDTWQETPLHFQDRVEIIEVWLDPCHYRRFLIPGPHGEPPRLDPAVWGKGMKVTVNGGRVIARRPAELHREWVGFPFDKAPEMFWADGDYDLIRQQDLADELLSLIIASIFYTGLPQTIINPTIVDKHQVRNQAGNIIETRRLNPGTNLQQGIFRLEGGGLAPEAAQFYAQLRDSFSQMALLMPVPNPREVTQQTAYAWAALREQYINSLRPLIMRFLDSFQILSKRLLEWAAELWEAPRYYMPLDGKEIEPEEIRGKDIVTELEIIVDPTSFAPAGQWDRQQLVADALKQQLIDISDPRIKHEVLATFSLQDIDRDYAAESAKAREDIRLILEGRADEIQINPVLDLSDIIGLTVVDYLRSERGRQLMREDPDKYQALCRYLEARLTLAEGDMMEAGRYVLSMLLWQNIDKASQETMMTDSSRICVSCMGSGGKSDDTCEQCGGAGQVPFRPTLQFHQQLARLLGQLPAAIGHQAAAKLPGAKTLGGLPSGPSGSVGSDMFQRGEG